MKKRSHLKILSFNIHKGFSSGNMRFTLKQIRKVLHDLQPDIVCLQEIMGYHDGHKKHFPKNPNISQAEYLAEGLWPHHSYGKNAIYTKGHHGNAILSRFNIESWENIDISKSSLENRGMLHAVIHSPLHKEKLHIICTHLGLFESYRNHQIQLLCKRVQTAVPQSEPLILAGDFNDWRKNASTLLWNKIKAKEAFLEANREHARTFPSWLPVLSLDRVYYRGFHLEKATCLSAPPWPQLSDHAALMCEFS